MCETDKVKRYAMGRRLCANVESRGEIRARVTLNEGREWEIGEKMAVERETRSRRVRGGDCTTLFEGRAVQRVGW